MQQTAGVRRGSTRRRDCGRGGHAVQSLGAWPHSKNPVTPLRCAKQDVLDGVRDD